MQKKSIKIVAISDTHNYQIPLPDGDILIHCGDFSCTGSIDEVNNFCKYINKLNFKHKIVISGNHELGLDSQFNNSHKYLSNQQVGELKQLMKQNCTYLEHEIVQVQGIRIFGSPKTTEFHDWAFMYKPSQGNSIWNIEEPIDILVTHGPPLGILDRVKTGCAGCPELLEAVFRLNPKYHLFGHIHEGYGHQELDNIKFYNCSILNQRYKVTNQPHVIEYEFK